MVLIDLDLRLVRKAVDILKFYRDETSHAANMGGRSNCCGLRSSSAEYNQVTRIITELEGHLLYKKNRRC